MLTESEAVKLSSYSAILRIVGFDTAETDGITIDQSIKQRHFDIQSQIWAEVSCQADDYGARIVVQNAAIEC